MANDIKFWREKHKPFMSQTELGKQIGLPQFLVSILENPNTHIDPDQELAHKIANKLNVLITDILRKEN